MRRLRVLSRVCLACGLCCDGTLFTTVPLTDSDPNVSGVSTRPNGSRFLRQRCACLEGKTCTAYAQRPLACRRFDCLLAVALLSNECTEAEALELVRGAHERIAAVEASLAPGPEATMQRARALTPAPEPLARAESFLRMHFVGQQRR